MNDRAKLKFSSPDPETQEVIVNRILPDNKLEPIGKIYLDYNIETNSSMYISTNNKGEEIFLPTTDFTDIERSFEKYSNELNEISYIEEYENRKLSIKHLRQWTTKPTN